MGEFGNDDMYGFCRIMFLQFFVFHECVTFLLVSGMGKFVVYFLKK